MIFGDFVFETPRKHRIIRM